MHKIYGIVIGFFVGLAVVACTGDSDAGSSGPTQAEVQAMINASIAPLQTEIETLKSQIGRDTVFANATGASKTGASVMAVTDIGTFLGDIPQYELPMVSVSGYYYCLTNARDSSEQAVVCHTDHIYYDNLGCTGNAYVNPNDAGTPYAAGTNGYVFRTATVATNVTDPATYLMVQPGTSLTEFTAMSTLTNGQSCTDSTSTVFGLLAVQNDPGTTESPVSGVNNAPITGPLSLGQ